MRGSWLLFCALLGGCSLGASLPEGRIGCEERSDCPANWFCRAAEQPGELGSCYRSELVPISDAKDGAALDAMSVTTADASVLVEADGSRDELDGGEMDAQSSDAELPDADVSLGDADAQIMKPDASGRPPVIENAYSLKHTLDTVTSTRVVCVGKDPDGDPLTYAWSAKQGVFEDPSASDTKFASTSVGPAEIRCSVSDNHGNSATSALINTRVYPEGLLTLLRFNSSDASDWSGRGNGGTLTGGLFAPDRAGNPNTALALDGNGYVTIARESAFDLNAWTFVVTVQPTAGFGGTLLSKAAAGTFGAFGVFMYRDNDPTLPGRLQYIQSDKGQIFARELGTFVARGGTFFQLAVTRGINGQLQAYVDGVRIYASQTNIPASEWNDAPVVLGDGPFGRYTGLLDEVQIYNRALSAEEVAALPAMQ